MLTELGAVFRGLKSELGTRPVQHRLGKRGAGHLFITVLACQAVQFIRRRLKQAGLDKSWKTLRKELSVQQRVTSCFRQRDGATLHVRQVTRPGPDIARLYDLLGIESHPGGARKFMA